MKIAYCLAGTRHSGGMERVLTNKANYWVGHGHEVVIVTTDQYGERPYFNLDSRVKCIDLGINYEENNGKSIWNKLAHFPLKQWQHRRRLQKVLEQEQPDCTVSMFCNDAPFLYKIKAGGRKFLEIHFSRQKRLQYGRSGLWRLADAWRSKQDERYIRHYEKFVVRTDEDRQLWGRHDNIVVIPNASSFHTEETASLASHVVTAVGRLTYQKGFERLVKAWSLLHDRFPDWQLQIVGDGEERESLLQQIGHLGLNGSIILHPATKDMHNIYLGSSLVAMSSRYEGLPMILIEAQTYGLPIVSFACKCGPRDIVTDGQDGYLVEEGDVEALAERMGRLMGDDALRKHMGEEARIASARFDEERVMAQWQQIFQQG